MESNRFGSIEAAQWHPPLVRWVRGLGRSTFRHPDAIKQVVQMAVNSVWERHIPVWYRPFIKARLDCVGLEAGSDLGWKSWGTELVLAVTEDSGTPDWYPALRYTAGHLMAYAFLVELAAIAAGADTRTGSVPVYRLGAPGAQWFVALQQPPWNQTVAAVATTRTMAKEILAAWGLDASKKLDDGDTFEDVDVVVDNGAKAANDGRHLRCRSKVLSRVAMDDVRHRRTDRTR